MHRKDYKKSRRRSRFHWWPPQ